MRLSQTLLVVFILVPIIEIYFLIKVGQTIGAGWTLLYIILTALIGTHLLKRQGLYTLNKAQSLMAQGQMPTEALLEGLLLLISGLLLLTPGFFTDAIGLAILLPPFRRYWLAHLLGYFQHRAVYRHQTNATSNHTIEGEYSKDD
jgi:UPF0716 protein FxsA